MVAPKMSTLGIDFSYKILYSSNRLLSYEP